MDAVRKKWADHPVSPSKDAADDAKVVERKNQIAKILNWEIWDDKHRNIDKILKTVIYLRKMLENVHNFSKEEKYRRIRITNPAFGKHIRDTPGGEKFLLAAGWHAAVINHERYFVFNHGEGSVEWRVAKEALKEVVKLQNLLENKIAKAVADNKKEIEKQRLKALEAIEEDKERRRVLFNYGDA